MAAPTCTLVNNGRYTTRDLLVRYLPCGVAANHVQKIYIHEDVASGNFKLVVNGNLTTAITFSSTAATLVSSINAALDALPNLAAGAIVASASVSEEITLTAIANAWYTIQVVEDALTGNTSDSDDIYTEVTTQGSTWYTLSSQISKFSFEVTVDFVDMTAISEYEGTEEPVKENMTFSLSIFDADEGWKPAVRAGYSGLMAVYPRGNFPGRKYFQFIAVFDKASTDMPDHEKVTVDMSGKRQGAMVVDFDRVIA